MKTYEHRVFVTIRPEAANMAGCWFREALAQYPHLIGKLPRDGMTFLLSLEKKKRDRISGERKFLERFARAWETVFLRIDASMLLSAESVGERGKPQDGPHALAEIVCDIFGALRSPEGRKPKIDPLEAYLDKTVRTNEEVAELFEVSVNTAKKAIGEGKITADAMRIYTSLFRKTKEVGVGPAVLVGTPETFQKGE